MKLANRTVNNALFNTLGWGLSLVLNFFLLPYIVTKLGTASYGILTLVLTVIGYFAVLDLGLGNAVIKYVAEYSATKDTKKINEVIGTTLLILILLGLFGGLVILAVSDSLVHSLLKIPPELVPAAYNCFRIGAAGFLVTIILSAVSAVPNGLNRYDITSSVTFFVGTVTMLGTVIVLVLGQGLLQVVCLNFAINLVTLICYPYLLSKLLPGIRLAPVVNIHVLRKVLSYGIYSFLSRVAYLLNYQADRIVMGAFIGVSSITYYVVPFTLVSRVTNITVKIGSVIFPAISELQGHQRYDTISELYLISSKIIFVLSMTICLPLFLCGSRFLTLWMGPDFGSKASTVLLLLTGGLLLNSMTNIPSFVADGLGRPKVTSLAGVAAAVANVGLLIPLTKFYGILGAAIAFLVSNAVVCPLFVWYVNSSLLKLSWLRYLKDVLLRPLLVTFFVLLPALFVPKDEITNIYALLGMMSLVSLAYLAVCCYAGALPQELISALLNTVKKPRLDGTDYVG